MSKNTKVCLACYALWIAFLQFISILYITGFISLRPIERLIFPCHKDYYFSELEILGDTYKFKDESACSRGVREKFNCVYSKKDTLSYYNDVHTLDHKSKSYLFSLEQNKTYYTNNMNEFTNLGAIDELINNAASKIKSVAFKPVFENSKLSNIFIITSYNPNKICDILAIDTLGGL